MCRERNIHFSHHDVRPLLCVNPFSERKADEYVDPIRITHCPCRHFDDNFMPPATDHLDRFRACWTHACCIIWAQITFCRLVGEKEHQDCANNLTTNEYHPLQMAAEPEPEAGKMIDALWEEDLPTLPIDMLYSPRVLETKEEAEELAKLHRRIGTTSKEVFSDKQELWDDFANLQRFMDEIRKLLTQIPAQVGMEPRLLRCGFALLRYLNFLGLVFEDLSNRLPERLSKLVRRQARALEMLRKDPAPDEDAVASDGLWRLSSHTIAQARLGSEGFLSEAKGCAAWKRAEELQREAKDLQKMVRSRLEDIAANRTSMKRKRFSDFGPNN